MLNISESSVGDNVRKEGMSTLDKVESRKSSRVLLRLIGGTFLLGLIVLFLPWTQNIRSYGNITTLKPDQRPQTIHSVIPGRIDKWYVQEGDHVKKGDTIAFMTEIKNDYFDPLLLDRTKDQTEFKKQTVVSYDEKVNALDNQITALDTQVGLKLEQGKIKFQQAQLKVTNDSIALSAAKNAYETAEKQYDRFEDLYDQGLKSKTDLENRNVKMQDAFSYLIEAENKYLASKQELIATQIELSNIQMKYQTDVAKAKSEKFSALSNKLDSEGQVTKLENQYANYELRNSFYYILAPQDCYITKLISNGIGETVKEGSPILSIMPTDYQLAAEVYVDPIDLPLLKVGEHVRLQFDGWPAIVFSGWPNASYGTYGGEIYAIDKYISENGKYRILVKEDPNDHPWPEALQFGGGANAMILLNDVPIWYELWRKVNGFPPNYYEGKLGTNKIVKKAK
jgi:adhesin transport system membrane fusion protein